MRIALGIEYQGSNYQGWQKQNNAKNNAKNDFINSLQLELEKALSKVADHKVNVVCAGRTDSGVHATSQVVHFDTSSNRLDNQWMLGANASLNKDIRVIWAKKVSGEFHARFSANYRHYQYLMWAEPRKIANSSALFGHLIVNPRKVLDINKMHEASQMLLGVHDFSAFRGSGCQAKTPIRSIDGISVKKNGDLIVIDIIANAFLYHMVRNIVGVLFEVGVEKKPITWVHDVLAGKNRDINYRTMPALGLYFVGVGYPDFPGVDRLSYFRKIMLISDHSSLVYKGENSSKKLYLEKEGVL